MDRNALSAQCEPLLAVAEAHAEGKEAFARGIATELFSDFLSVEERFAANKEATEQEVIDSLRQVNPRLDFAIFWYYKLCYQYASLIVEAPWNPVRVAD